jgi:uncharacterized protein YjeT (DUF2065 family)
MPTTDEKRETGAALIVAGCLAWFFEFLVLFFLPAAWRQGHHAGFFAAMACLAAVGLVLVMLGFRDRREVGAK